MVFMNDMLYLLPQANPNHCQGVELCTGATLLYSDDRIASISASMRANLPSEAFITGSKGTIKVRWMLLLVNVTKVVEIMQNK